MLYRLIVLTGPLKNQRITVDSEPMTLGRAPDCEISIPDDEVAQKHAVLEHKPDGGLRLRDLGTMNKLLVNGREAREARLKHGDMVEIGRTRFLVQAVVQAEVSGSGSGEADEGVNPKVVIAAVLVLILGVVTVLRWPGRHPKPAPVPVAAQSTPTASNVVVALATSTPPVTAPVPATVIAAPVDNQTTQITAELRRLRDDLDSVKARQFAQSNNPPPATLVQAPPVFAAPAPPVAIPPEPVAATSAPAVVATQTDTTAMTTAATRPKPAGRILRVLNVVQSRLPPSDDIDDLRAFTVHLAQIDPSVEIDNAQLRVTITFYDEDEQTGEVHASTQVAPQTDLRPSEPWGADRRGTVTATYALPKGSRAKALAAGRAERYHGHVIRVDYAGREQDVWSQPRALTAAPEPAGTAVANGSGSGRTH